MRIADEERRRRLVARHHLRRTAADAEHAVADVVAMHSSDPLTPHLGAWARIPGYVPDHLDVAVDDRRTLWRLHAMRRTLFVVTVEDAPTVLAGASREVARRERRRLHKLLAAELPDDQIEPWLEARAAEVLDALGDGERSTTDLVAQVPALELEVTSGSGKWVRRAKVASNVLFLLAMDGTIVRTRPAGSWRSSQYRWAAAASWFAPHHLDAVMGADEEAAQIELARRYLARHGPATVTDLRWWTGWTKRVTDRALAELDTVTVDLEDGEPGLVLADDTDVDGAGPDGPVASLLPGLDPTPMGWKQRDWSHGPHEAAVHDSIGNVGPTVWLDGQLVGGWGQRPDGQVVCELLEPVTAAGRDAIDAEVAALTGWLDGAVVAPRFPSPLHRRLSEHTSA